MRSLTITSINANGMKDRAKLALLFGRCRISDILFIQETHASSFREIDSWSNLWSGRFYYSFGTPRSSGVAIGLARHLDYEVHGFDHDLEGRMVWVDLTIDSCSLRLVCIYAPNLASDRRDFLTGLQPVCTTSRHVILGGDFNFVEDLGLDKAGGNSTTGNLGSTEVRSLSRDCELHDSFRYLYPGLQLFSYHRADAGQTLKSRLDRFYVPTHFLQAGLVRSVCITPNTFSDHSFVDLVLDGARLSHSSRGPGYWKCNVETLSDDSLGRDMEQLWFQHLSLAPSKDGAWWDQCKREFRTLIMRHSKRLRSDLKRRIRQMEEDIRFLRDLQRHELVPGTFAVSLEAAMGELNTLLLSEFRGQVVRSKVSLLEQADRPSRFFLRREAQHGRAKCLTHLRSAGGIDLHDSADIQAECRSFYADLFREEPPLVPQQGRFLAGLPSLSPELRASCDGPLTFQECFEAIRSMDNGKSPGLDGLPKEFYVRFFYLFGRDFVALINSCATAQWALPPSMRLALITLLCKDPEHAYLLKNWRPISLLNVDYKIVSKSLSLRLRQALPDLLSVFQTCSVPGRSIMDNLHLLRNVVDYVDSKVLPCSLVNIDQEKAFDRVNHDYLFRVLEHFGFGPDFLGWIRLLYREVSSSVLVNGFVTDPFAVTRSVRQGCSLSPMLYILCLEPLALAIRRCADIVGLSVPLFPEQIKLCQYADDLTVIITRDWSLDHLLALLLDFCRATGSKINQQKSKGMFLGAWRHREDSPSGFTWVRTMNLLGVIFDYRGPAPELVWPGVLRKFQGTLEVFKDRSRSCFGRALLLNAMACSKLWFVSAVSLLPPSWGRRFNSAAFKFLWNDGHEWLSRATMTLPKSHGGVGMVNLDLKVQAFLVKHIVQLLSCFGKPAAPPWTYFARYWIGMTLRQHNAALFTNACPNAESPSPFYAVCLRLFRHFLAILPEPDMSRLTVKSVYRVLLLDDTPPLRVIREHPAVQFRRVWYAVHLPALLPEERDLAFRAAHGVLPVKTYLNRCHFGLNNERCYLCERGRETLEHTFILCPMVQALWGHFWPHLERLCNHRLKLDIPTVIQSYDQKGSFPSLSFRSFFWLILGILRRVIWECRGRSKFDKVHCQPLDALRLAQSRVRLRHRLDHERSPLWAQTYWVTSFDLFD